MKRVGWYLHRLRAMSVPELGYRGAQRFRMGVERATTVLNVQVLSDNALWRGLYQAGSADWEAWARAMASRPRRGLLASAEPHCFSERYPEAARALIESANAAAAGRLRFFGHLDVQLADPPDWHRDPVTGRRWPRDAFYGDVGTRWGGAKTIWEAARHQHLITLAQAYWLTSDTRYSAGIQRQLQSWFDQNAPLRGVHWTSGLEVGVRLLSWFWVYVLTRSATFPASLCREWTRAIVLSGTYLADHFSAYSSANNHLIGEASGLLAAALLVPEWQDAARWRDRALSVLEREIELQILPDGAPAEQAVHYHGFVIDFYLWCMMLARVGQVAAAPALRTRLERAGEFLVGLMDAGGALPDVGDSDGGYAYTLAADDADLTRSRLATLAVMCDRGDFKRAARCFDAGSWWLLGEVGARAFDALPEKPLARASAFEHGGYWVLRGDTSDAGAEPQLVFDCGPLGYLSLAAHGHADCLAVWLSVGGHPLLVDTGTYAYHEEPEWRAYFRGTASHNTVRVDGVDQSEATGSTMWGRRAHATIIGQHRTAALDWVEGQHDGYSRLPNAVVHRRAVGFVRPQYFVVIDWLLGTGQHTVEQFFHFPAHARVRLEGGDCEVRVNGCGATLLLRPVDGAAISVTAGETHPIRGWQSPHFGAKVPSPTLMRQRTGSCPIVLATVIWLGPGAPPLWDAYPASDPAALRFALETADWRDDFFVGRSVPATPVMIGAQKVAKRVVYARTSADHVTHVVSLD